MAESYTKKYNIQHFFIWNSRPTSSGGKKYGDYVHFASNEMNNMIDEGTIRFSPAGINNIDPSFQNNNNTNISLLICSQYLIP